MLTIQKKLISYLLSSVADIADVDPNDMSASMLKGRVELQNVRLRTGRLNKLLLGQSSDPKAHTDQSNDSVQKALELEFTEGVAGLFEIQVPWLKAGEPVRADFTDVRITVKRRRREEHGKAAHEQEGVNKRLTREEILEAVKEELVLGISDSFRPADDSPASPDDKDVVSQGGSSEGGSDNDGAEEEDSEDDNFESCSEGDEDDTKAAATIAKRRGVMGYLGAVIPSAFKRPRPIIITLTNIRLRLDCSPDVGEQTHTKSSTRSIEVVIGRVQATVVPEEEADAPNGGRAASTVATRVKNIEIGEITILGHAGEGKPVAIVSVPPMQVTLTESITNPKNLPAVAPSHFIRPASPNATYIRTMRSSANVQQSEPVIVDLSGGALLTLKLCLLGFMKADDVGKSGVGCCPSTPLKWQYLKDKVIERRRAARTRYDFSLPYLKDRAKLRKEYMALVSKLVEDRLQFLAFRDQLCNMEMEIRFRDVVFALRRHCHAMAGTSAMLHNGVVVGARQLSRNEALKHLQQHLDDGSVLLTVTEPMSVSARLQGAIVLLPGGYAIDILTIKVMRVGELSTSASIQTFRMRTPFSNRPTVISQQDDATAFLQISLDTPMPEVDASRRDVGHHGTVASTLNYAYKFVDVTVEASALNMVFTASDLFTFAEPLLQVLTHTLIAATAAARAYRASDLYIDPHVYSLVDGTIHTIADASYVRGSQAAAGGDVTVTVTRAQVTLRHLTATFEQIGLTTADTALTIVTSSNSKGMLADVKCNTISVFHGGVAIPKGQPNDNNDEGEAVPIRQELLAPVNISTDARSNTITVSPVAIVLSPEVALDLRRLATRMKPLVPADLIYLVSQGITAEAAKSAEAGLAGDDATTFAGDSMSTATGVSMATGVGGRTFAKAVARKRVAAATSPANRMIGVLFEVLNRSRKPKRMHVDGVDRFPELHQWVRRSRYPTGVVVTEVKVCHPGLVDLKVTSITISHHERYESLATATANALPSLHTKRHSRKDASLVIAITSIDASMFGERVIASMQKLSAEAVLIVTPAVVVQATLDNMTVNFREGPEDTFDPIPFLDLRNLRAANCAGHTDLAVDYVNVCGEGAHVENVVLGMAPRIGVKPVDVRPTVTGDLDLALRVKTLDLRCLTGPRFLPLNTILFHQIIPWAVALAPPLAIRLFMSSLTDITLTVREGQTVLTSYNGLVALAEICSSDAKQQQQAKGSIPVSARGSSPTPQTSNGSTLRSAASPPPQQQGTSDADSASIASSLGYSSIVPKRLQVRMVNDTELMTQTIKVECAILILHTPSSLDCAAHLHLPTIEVVMPIARMEYWSQCPPLLSQTTTVQCPAIQAAFVACVAPPALVSRGPDASHIGIAGTYVPYSQRHQSVVAGSRIGKAYLSVRPTDICLETHASTVRNDISPAKPRVMTATMAMPAASDNHRLAYALSRKGRKERIGSDNGLNDDTRGMRSVFSESEGDMPLGATAASPMAATADTTTDMDSLYAAADEEAPEEIDRSDNQHDSSDDDDGAFYYGPSKTIRTENQSTSIQVGAVHVNSSIHARSELLAVQLCIKDLIAVFADIREPLEFTPHGHFRVSNEAGKTMQLGDKSHLIGITYDLTKVQLRISATRPKTWQPPQQQQQQQPEPTSLGSLIVFENCQFLEHPAYQQMTSISVASNTAVLFRRCTFYAPGCTVQQLKRMIPSNPSTSVVVYEGCQWKTRLDTTEGEAAATSANVTSRLPRIIAPPSSTPKLALESDSTDEEEALTKSKKDDSYPSTPRTAGRRSSNAGSQGADSREAKDDAAVVAVDARTSIVVTVKTLIVEVKVSEDGPKLGAAIGPITVATAVHSEQQPTLDNSGTAVSVAVTALTTNSVAVSSIVTTCEVAGRRFELVPSGSIEANIGQRSRFVREVTTSKVIQSLPTTIDVDGSWLVPNVLLPMGLLDAVSAYVSALAAPLDVSDTTMLKGNVRPTPPTHTQAARNKASGEALAEELQLRDTAGGSGWLLDAIPPYSLLEHLTVGLKIPALRITAYLPTDLPLLAIDLKDVHIATQRPNENVSFAAQNATPYFSSQRSTSTRSQSARGGGHAHASGTAASGGSAHSKTSVECSKTAITLVWSVSAYDQLVKSWSHLIQHTNLQVEAIRSATSANVCCKLFPLNVSVSSSTLRSMSFVSKFIAHSRQQNLEAIRRGLADSNGGAVPSSPSSMHSSVRASSAVPSLVSPIIPIMSPLAQPRSTMPNHLADLPYHTIINEVGCPIEVGFADHTAQRLKLDGVYKSVSPFEQVVAYITVGNMKKVQVAPFADITTRRYQSAGLAPAPQQNHQADMIDAQHLAVPIAFLNEDPNVLFAQRSVTYVGDSIEIMVERILTSAFTEEIRVRSCCVVENHSAFHFIFGPSCPLTINRMESAQGGEGAAAHQHRALKPAQLAVPPHARVGVPLWLLDDWSVSVALAQQLAPDTSVGHNSTSQFLGGSFRSLSQEILSKGETSRLLTRGFSLGRRSELATSQAQGKPITAHSASTAYASLTFGVDRASRLSTVHLHHATAGIRNGLRFALTVTFYSDSSNFDEASKRGTYVAEPDSTVFSSTQNPRERLTAVVEVRTPAGVYASTAIPLHPRSLISDEATPCKLFRVPEELSSDPSPAIPTMGAIGTWLGGLVSSNPPPVDEGEGSPVRSEASEAVPAKSATADSSAVARNVVDTMTTDYLQVFLLVGADGSMPILHIGPHPEFIYVINRTSHSLRLHPFEDSEEVAGLGHSPIPTAGTAYVRSAAYKISTRETSPSTAITLEPQLAPSIIACHYLRKTTLVCEKFMLQSLRVNAAPCSSLRPDPDAKPPMPFKTTTIEIISPYVIINSSTTERLVVESRARNRSSNNTGTAHLTVVEPMGVAYLSRCSQERKYVNEFRIAFAAASLVPSDHPKLSTTFSAFVTDDSIRKDFTLMPLSLDCKSTLKTRYHIMRIIRPTVTGATELYIDDASPPPVVIVNATQHTLSECKPFSVANSGLATLDPHLLLSVARPSPAAKQETSWESLSVAFADSCGTFTIPKASLEAQRVAEARFMGAGEETAKLYGSLAATSPTKVEGLNDDIEAEGLLRSTSPPPSPAATAADPQAPLLAAIRALDCPDHLRRFILVILPPASKFPQQQTSALTGEGGDAAGTAATNGNNPPRTDALSISFTITASSITLLDHPLSTTAVSKGQVISMVPLLKVVIGGASVSAKFKRVRSTSPQQAIDEPEGICIFDFNIDNLSATDLSAVDVSNRASVTASARTALERCGLYGLFTGQDPPVRHSELRAQSMSINCSPMQVTLTERLVACLLQYSRNAVWAPASASAHGLQSALTAQSATSAITAGQQPLRGYAAPWKRRAFLRCRSKVEDSADITNPTLNDRFSLPLVPSPIRGDATVKYVTSDTLTVGEVSVVVTWEKSAGAGTAANLIDNKILSYLLSSVKRMTIVVPEFRRDKQLRAHAEVLQSDLMWHYINSVKSQWRSIITSFGLSQISTVAEGVGFIGSKVLGLFSAFRSASPANPLQGGGEIGASTDPASALPQPGTGLGGVAHGVTNLFFGGERMKLPADKAPTNSANRPFEASETEDYSASWLCLHCKAVEEYVKRPSFEVNQDTMRNLLTSFGPTVFIHHTGPKELLMVLGKNTILKPAKGTSSASAAAQSAPVTYYRLDGSQNITSLLPMIRLTNLRRKGIGLPKGEVGEGWLDGVPPRMLSLKQATSNTGLPSADTLSEFDLAAPAVMGIILNSGLSAHPKGFTQAQAVAAADALTQWSRAFVKGFLKNRILTSDPQGEKSYVTSTTSEGSDQQQTSP